MHFKRKILTTENSLYFAICQQLKHFKVIQSIYP